MKKRIGLGLLLLAIIAAAGWLPFQSSDVAQLVPIETLVISLDDGWVILDGGEALGRGKNWEEAWRDLHHGANGRVFLGTVEQVVLSGAAVELLSDAAWNEELRPAATVCTALGSKPDPKEATTYLSAHNGGVTLQQARAALLKQETIKLPILVQTEGGLRLYGTQDW